MTERDERIAFKLLNDGVVVRGEECAALGIAREGAKDRTRDGSAVERRRAAPKLVHNDKRTWRGILEDLDGFSAPWQTIVS